MKSLKDRLNEFILDDCKKFTAAVKNLPEEFIKIHKPTDTINDYMDWGIDQVRKLVVQIFGNFFSKAQINEFVRQFIDDTNDEIRSMGFKRIELFDDYIKAVMKKRKK